MARYGWDYSSRNFGGRGFAPRYGGDFRQPRGYGYGGDYTVHGFYAGPSHYWGQGHRGNAYGASDYNRGPGRGYDRQGGGYAGQGRGRGRGGFGYYGQGIDDGLSQFYSGTYRNHGTIGESPGGGEMVYPPGYRGQGRGPRGGGRRYDRGW